MAFQFYFFALIAGFYVVLNFLSTWMNLLLSVSESVPLTMAYLMHFVCAIQRRGNSSFTERSMRVRTSVGKSDKGRIKKLRPLQQVPT